MKEIIRANLGETGKKKEGQEIEELKNFPDEVRELFHKLPDIIKNKIFSRVAQNKSKNSPEENERSLEEIVAGFDIKTREKFMARCLSELFNNGKFKDILEGVDEDDLRQEVGRLLNQLWQNRGKRDNLQLFNQEYYASFFQARSLMIEKIQAKKMEIEKLNASIVTTIKQKRLTERKRGELKALEAELDVLTEELKKYDEQNGNSALDYMYFRDVASRQRKEREWTKAVTLTSEYLDPTEFATAIAEQLDRVFYQETSMAQNPKKKIFGRTLPENIVERARKVINSVDAAIEGWYTIHKNDGSFKQPSAVKLAERQAKLLDYLISLMRSYQMGKEQNKTDDEMIYTIRQMEVSLNILGK